MNKNMVKKLQKGQALITLLFFMVIAVTITTASVVILFVTTASTSKLEQGTRSYYVAESGIENALLRLLRDPSYAGETISVDDGSAVVTVSGSSPYIITSVGEVGTFQRTIQAEADYSGGVLSVTDWREI